MLNSSNFQFSSFNQQNKRTVVEAVETAVRVLEENGRFNAGRGSYKNEKGEVECDAMIMDGEKLNAGMQFNLIW